MKQTEAKWKNTEEYIQFKLRDFPLQWYITQGYKCFFKTNNYFLIVSQIFGNSNLHFAYKFECVGYEYTVSFALILSNFLEFP